ncbi:hypothetical protein HYS31_00275 [Candidatus Woesearchaeota archaeon]|nr:hypothetical protein [Candidatus Woesearchaeota archaeon]
MRTHINFISISVNDDQFKRFIKSMTSIGLERKPRDKSTFPLDFVAYYKDKYELNFEYLSGNLHFYLIGSKNNKTDNFTKKEIGILQEIKKKIKAAIKSKIKE